MSLSPQQVTELRKSWVAVSADPAVLTEGTYSELFRLAPQVAPLFASTEMGRQRSKLAAALARLVRDAGDIGTLVPALHDLGRKHAGFGVSEAQHAAWAAADGTVAATMQVGATPLRQSA